VSDTKKTSNKTSSGRSDIVDLTSSIGKDKKKDSTVQIPLL
jgi:hypothetical protein